MKIRTLMEYLIIFKELLIFLCENGMVILQEIISYILRYILKYLQMKLYI